MFHHALLLQKIALALHQRLAGTHLSHCFSQNKDELVLIFTNNEQSTCIKADLRPQVSLLSFPENFSRARKNSVDLFHQLIDKKVTAVIVHPLNRSFEITFGTSSLIFKMYGRRSNIIHFQHNELHGMFRSALKQDLLLERKDFFENQELLNVPFNEQSKQILGKRISNYIQNNLKKSNLNTVCNHLLAQPTYVSEGDNPTLSIVKSEEGGEKSFTDVLEAVNYYHLLFVRNNLFEQEKSKGIQQLTKTKDRTLNYLRKTRQKLSILKKRRSYRETADIIMANLHQIKTGDKQAKLYDFYTDQDITIKLKEKLTPQLNAELLYKKAKNEQLEIKKLEQNIQQKENILLDLELRIEQIRNVADWKELRKISADDRDKRDNKQLPYFTFWYGKYEIRVGKDAKRNDQLTTRHASKEDLWLHAKDVPGSHVIIRTSDKSKPPTDVIEYAARLAAYYSKRKTDTLCPVLFTPRKYVRKSKKLAAGMVIVEREEVILVEPLNPNRT
jgi:predicted ribosome quality control (RQC) complex YloA/Tae2 family protein